MNEKKPMRGGDWLLFLGAIALILYEAISSLLAGKLNEEGIVPAIFGLLYLAVYFVLPLLWQKQAAPALPEENPALAAPADLTLIRDSSPVAAALPTRIYSDGHLLCSLKSGDSVTVRLDRRYTLLMTDTTGSKNCKILLEAPEGGNGSLHLASGVFRPKTLKW